MILKDGSLRSVVLASAINFDLMSRPEQDAVEFAYQGFLNSLHFPVQIVIRSQKVDLDNYLEHLTDLRESQDNELLGVLMEDYIANIKGLIDEVNIMNKQFYVTVPYFPPAITKSGFFDNLGTIFKPTNVTTVGEADFAQYKTELSQRVALVASGLNQMGIRAIPLNTQELIDLYYSTYNPDTATNQKLIDASQLQGPVVTREDGPVTAPAITTTPTTVVAPSAPAPTPAAPPATPSPAPTPATMPVAPSAPAPVSPAAPASPLAGFDPYAVSANSPAAAGVMPAANPASPLAGAAAELHPDQKPPTPGVPL